MYCLPRYLLMVFAFAGDSTMTRAFAIDETLPSLDDLPELADNRNLTHDHARPESATNASASKFSHPDP